MTQQNMYAWCLFFSRYCFSMRKHSWTERMPHNLPLHHHHCTMNLFWQRGSRPKALTMPQLQPQSRHWTRVSWTPGYSPTAERQLRRPWFAIPRLWSKPMQGRGNIATPTVPVSRRTRLCDPLGIFHSNLHGACFQHGSNLCESNFQKATCAFEWIHVVVNHRPYPSPR